MNVINDIFQEFRKNKSNMEMSIEEFKDNISKFKDRIVLYGAGSSGIAFLYFLRYQGIEPIYFIDADKKKQGNMCENLRILSPKDGVKVVGNNCLVIVCINTDGKRYCKSFDEALSIGGHHAVYSQLRKYGYRNIIDYTYFRKCYKLFEHEEYNAPSCSDVYLMEKNETIISEIYERLSDKKSKSIYENIIRFRLLDDSLTIPTDSQDKQYFEYDYWNKDKDEVVLDIGAYNGISLKTFLLENENNFSKYYCIEPDQYNYNNLIKYIDSLDISIKNKIICINKCLWSHNTNLNLYALNGPGSFVSSIGKQKTEAITIDKLMNNKKVSFIKMNIEGSEKQALLGGKQTICGYKPKLAVAGYHKTDDLWRIPQIILNYRNDYKIYLKSYMNHISFIYYCV